MDMPFAFADVCHAASGGLPRDMLRYASRMYELADETSPDDLDLVEGCRTLGVEDIKAALSVLSVEVAKLDANPYVHRLLAIFRRSVGYWV